MDMAVGLLEPPDVGHALRRAMANVAASVAVATVQADGQTLGVTISSLISLSLEPPLVSIALRAGSALLRRLAGTHFGITVLAEHQREIAMVLSAPHRPPVPRVWLDDAEPDSLRLRDGAAWMLARTEGMHPAGDHVIVIARVLAAHAGERLPLLHHRRSYCAIAPLDQPAASQR